MVQAMAKQPTVAIAALILLCASACKRSFVPIAGLSYELPAGWEISYQSENSLLSRKPTAGVGMYFPIITVHVDPEPGSLDENEASYREAIGAEQWRTIQRRPDLEKLLPGVKAQGFTRRYVNSSAKLMWKPGDDKSDPLSLDYVETTVFVLGSGAGYQVKFGAAASLYEGASVDFEDFLKGLKFGVKQP